MSLEINSAILLIKPLAGIHTYPMGIIVLFQLNAGYYRKNKQNSQTVIKSLVKYIFFILVIKLPLDQYQ